MRGRKDGWHWARRRGQLPPGCPLEMTFPPCPSLFGIQFPGGGVFDAGRSATRFPTHRRTVWRAASSQLIVFLAFWERIVVRFVYPQVGSESMLAVARPGTDESENSPASARPPLAIEAGCHRQSSHFDAARTRLSHLTVQAVTMNPCEPVLALSMRRELLGPGTARPLLPSNQASPRPEPVGPCMGAHAQPGRAPASLRDGPQTKSILLFGLRVT